MDVSLLVQAVFLGFTIAAPVGPIGLLCIQRTLTQGIGMGVATGLGAATADAIYGAISALGLAAISQLLIDGESIFKLVGGAFLLHLGVSSLIRRKNLASDSNSAPNSNPVPGIGLLNGGPSIQTNHRFVLADGVKAYVTTVLLTLANPVTILMFVSLFASVGLGEAGRGPFSRMLFVVGVFLGSALWWLFLSTGVSVFRFKLSPAVIGGINLLSGLAIAVFGGVTLVAGLRAIV